MKIKIIGTDTPYHTTAQDTLSSFLQKSLWGLFGIITGTWIADSRNDLTMDENYRRRNRALRLLSSLEQKGWPFALVKLLDKPHIQATNILLLYPLHRERFVNNIDKLLQERDHYAQRSTL